MGSLLRSISLVNRRLRLLIALFLALALYAILFYRHAGPVMAFLVGWVLFSGTLLLFSWGSILFNDPHQAALVARAQDSSRFTIFFFVVAAAFISLFAIIAFLQGLPRYSREGLTGHMLLSLLAISFSWALIHTLFTLHYAHLYYHALPADGAEGAGGGLSFPGDHHPDLLDFAYFSFVVGMTFQVSDVTIHARRIRRFVLVHGLLSFIFNTVIVAFAINVLSGILGR
jgi:uncharacterized membrane protein